jgi:hypothetical protein
MPLAFVVLALSGKFFVQNIAFVIFQLDKFQVHFFSLVEFTNIMPTHIDIIGLLSLTLVLHQKKWLPHYLPSRSQAISRA